MRSRNNAITSALPDTRPLVADGVTRYTTRAAARYSQGLEPFAEIRPGALAGVLAARLDERNEMRAPERRAGDGPGDGPGAGAGAADGADGAGGAGPAPSNELRIAAPRS
jgi:hypothetical protein